ncbi:DNA-binding response regulator [Limibacter armeniacum]|uniref:LytR/AlgR family response regulator transcription factor n=1 Tax=Limibacter armeniacum TaxID=466084 RepID=UPI002FE645E1
MTSAKDDHLESKECVLILEDDIKLLNNLAEKVRQLGYDVIEATDSKMAISLFREHIPSAMISDIQLGEGDISGIDTVRMLQNQYNFAVIYLTSFVDSLTIQKAKTTLPFQYLIKPVSDKELEVGLALSLELYHSTKPQNIIERVSTFFIKSNSEAYAKKVSIEDILLIRAERAYSELTLSKNGEKVLVSYNLSQILNKLNNHPDLLRVHRSYCVNWNYVRGVGTSELVLESPAGEHFPIPIGKFYRNEVVSRMEFL